MNTIDKRPVAAAAAAQALIVAGINVAASFGWVTLTADQLSNINVFLALALPAILGFLIRNKIVAVVDLEWVEDDADAGPQA